MSEDYQNKCRFGRIQRRVPALSCISAVCTKIRTAVLGRSRPFGRDGSRPILLKNSMFTRHLGVIEKSTSQIGPRSTISHRVRGAVLPKTWSTDIGRCFSTESARSGLWKSSFEGPLQVAGSNPQNYRRNRHCSIQARSNNSIDVTSLSRYATLSSLAHLADFAGHDFGSPQGTAMLLVGTLQRRGCAFAPAASWGVSQVSFGPVRRCTQVLAQHQTSCCSRRRTRGRETLRASHPSSPRSFLDQIQCFYPCGKLGTSWWPLRPPPRKSLLPRICSMS